MNKLEYKGYTGAAKFDNDAGVLHGRVLGINDVITFEAKDADSLYKEFVDSVDDYLDMCREEGVEPNKNYSGQYLLRMAPEIHQRLDELSKLQDRNMSAVAVEAIETYIKKATSESEECAATSATTISYNP